MRGDSLTRAWRDVRECLLLSSCSADGDTAVGHEGDGVRGDPVDEDFTVEAPLAECAPGSFAAAGTATAIATKTSTIRITNPTNPIATFALVFTIACPSPFPRSGSLTARGRS